MRLFMNQVTNFARKFTTYQMLRTCFANVKHCIIGIMASEEQDSNGVSVPQIFVYSIQDALQLISNHENHTTTKFAIYQSSKDFGHAGKPPLIKNLKKPSRPS
jgi:hypothetical protein